MNALRTLASSALLLALLMSCGQTHRTPDPLAAVTTTEEATEQLEQHLVDAELRYQERASRGDTLSLHYKELQLFLPGEVAGFVREGEPQGESVNMGSVSYSTCEQRYRRGNQHLKVQLVDYNGANALYAGATALMGLGSQENDEQLMQSCDLGMPGVRGYETLQKKEHHATVALGVGDRFFVSVESTQQQDTRLVKEIARQLNLTRLAEL
ncbi:hypothetical protein [Solirubrum puertoriconensis]|uniref:Secreted protein n=1 Tax=Solirubrum puertoriconensis TaxID=1751427 RepID=A0A9X0HLI8_SOLP1|nr:hypothetical protein [Solirubrum puertoriconensis]KUG08227.1 hypothetical protein ASU33_08565 [Solirubrum puertoriconensis]